MKVPADRLYTKTHEWIRIEGDKGMVGITDFAQDNLTDVTFVELPEVGRRVQARDQVCVIESVKAAADIYSPVAGTISAVNTELESHPELINSDPYGKGWIFELALEQPAATEGLLSAEEYGALLTEK
ncbi:MAG: glycine cleavage system protein GcvH [Verrucomicrobia bacterium]|nr:MAG: glycine cleavage system protein GcvH [Verrucomicrobiota bacterium]